MIIKKINNIECKYIDLNEKLNLHFWGNESLISDTFGNHTKFGKVQTDILELCNGIYTTDQIVNMICQKYVDISIQEYYQAKQKIIEFIEIGITRRYLVERDVPLPTKSSKAAFSGERGKYYPYVITLEITSRCNYKCPFCYKTSTEKGTDLDRDRVEQIMQLKGKVKEIRFLGGEPFLYPDFEELLKKVSQYFKVSVVTNGSLLYLVNEEALLCIDQLQFSMYGYSNNTYKNNTGVQGWDSLKKSVEKANKLRINYKICLTLGKDTIKQMENYVLAAIAIGGKEINFGMPSPVGRAVATDDNKDNYIFSKEDFRLVYFKMRDLKIKYRDRINIVVWQHSTLYREEAPVAFSACEGCLECGGGWYSLVVSENGLVRACELLPEDIFSYGDMAVVIQNIADKGHFYVNEMKDMIGKYKKILGAQDIKLNEICFALDKIQ